MPAPFELVRCRSWHAKTPARRMAEMQFSQDRDSAHIAKDNWKALRQMMWNDLRNAADSNEMVSKYGPANWGGELSALGMLNDRLAALSTLPAYAAKGPMFPMPVVDRALPLVPPPMPMPMPVSMPMAPAMTMPMTMPVAMPPMMAAPAMAPVVPAPMMAPGPAVMAPSFINNMPVTVGPVIMGFMIVNMLGTMEAIAPAAAHFDVSIQRMTAVEGLTEKSIMMGGNGVVNLRLFTTPIGDVVAAGDVVIITPMM